MPTRSVDSLLEDVRLLGENLHDTVQVVRATVRRAIDPLSEDVKYGGIVFSSRVSFGGVFAYKDHVSVEFSRGATITDPFGHLEGAGKLRRHLKLVSPADVEHKRLAEYLPLVLAAANAAA